MAGVARGLRQFDQLVEAKLAVAPGLDLFNTLRQLQSGAALQLCQVQAFGVIDHGRTQRRVVIQAAEQGFGGSRGAQRFLA